MRACSLKTIKDIIFLSQLLIHRFASVGKIKNSEKTTNTLKDSKYYRLILKELLKSVGKDREKILHIQQPWMTLKIATKSKD